LISLAGSRGLKRLIVFVVFLIPLGWYLFLQLFGSNTYSLDSATALPENCEQFTEVTVVYTSDSLTAAQTNHFNRVSFKSSQKKIELQKDSGNLLDCAGVVEDLILVDSDGIWGAYELSREGVDRLLTELDILIIQKSYGKGISR
jgi:hypothetical protein